MLVFFLCWYFYLLHQGEFPPKQHEAHTPDRFFLKWSRINGLDTYPLIWVAETTIGGIIFGSNRANYSHANKHATINSFREEDKDEVKYIYIYLLLSPMY